MSECNGREPHLPGRRQFLALGLGVFTVASVPFLRARRRLVRRSLPLMGTLAEVGVVHQDERYAWAAAGAALATLSEVEGRLTRFRGDSEIGRANRRAFGESVPVSAETAGVLLEALRVAGASAGRFDPCLGAAVVAWDVGRRRTPLAPATAERFAHRHLHRALDVEPDRTGGRVRFHHPDVALDLGGIGKGHGVDRAVETLREWGIADGLVNVGGDLYALGRSPEGDPWTVGVRAPDDAARMVAQFDVEDAAVATSGDYEQGFDRDGRRYHHILDPETGAPVLSPRRSVTIRADRCVHADAWATAVFGSDAPTAEALLHRADSTTRLIHLV